VRTKLRSTGNNKLRAIWPFVFYPDQAFGQANSNEVRNLTQSQDPSPGERNTGGKERDGQHDFDFLPGTWKVHNRRLTHPLSGSTTWVEFESTSVAKKVWDGRANMDEYEAGSPSAHIEGLTVRLYNPKSHQWNIYWANSKDGTLGQPMIGEFKNGRGEFFDQEPFNGRAILVRYVWSDITPSSAHFEQSYSDDGGKTWEVNWITNQTRVKDESDKAH
jgi:hypothetical protein